MIPNSKFEIKSIIFFIQQGEGVPSSRKGVCANHVRDVEKFFKVSINRHV